MGNRTRSNGASCSIISLGDIQLMPTRSVFTFFQTFLNFWSNAPKCRHLGGGMCMLFEICEKTPFQKCMGWGGIGDLKPDQNRQKKPNLSTVMGNFRENMVPDPLLTNTSPKSPLQGLSEFTPQTPPLGHSAGTNEATITAIPENAPCWHVPDRPREICPDAQMKVSIPKTVGTK